MLKLPHTVARGALTGKHDAVGLGDFPDIGRYPHARYSSFNTYDDQEMTQHRQRMRVILGTAGLQAYSMTMYAGWREVIASYVAHRIGAEPGDLMPQTVGWLMLGVALSAYEHWLADESVSLTHAIATAFDVTRPGLEALAPAGVTAAPPG